MGDSLSGVFRTGKQLVLFIQSNWPDAVIRRVVIDRLVPTFNKRQMIPQRPMVEVGD
jgi:hypothetical protein